MGTINISFLKQKKGTSPCPRTSDPFNVNEAFRGGEKEGGWRMGLYSLLAKVQGSGKESYRVHFRYSRRSWWFILSQRKSDSYY
jgi:hypothetical protein